MVAKNKDSASTLPAAAMRLDKHGYVKRIGCLSDGCGYWL
jgi:hypothetical protein